MACCPSAPSHDPKQCWPLAWVRSTYIDLREISLKISEPWIYKFDIEMTYIKFQWVNTYVWKHISLFYNIPVNPFYLKWHVKYRTLGMEKDNAFSLLSCLDGSVMQFRKVKLLCHNGAIYNLTHYAPMIWYAAVELGKNCRVYVASSKPNIASSIVWLLWFATTQWRWSCLKEIYIMQNSFQNHVCTVGHILSGPHCKKGSNYGCSECSECFSL